VRLDVCHGTATLAEGTADSKCVDMLMREANAGNEAAVKIETRMLA
jgi:hypothetical protein